MFRLAPLIVLVACSGSGKRAGTAGGIDGGSTAPAVKKSGSVTLFFTTELMGSLEPCGCTSDPMGYIERTAALIEEARKDRPVALFDGGSTLYPEPPIAAEKLPQEHMEADLLASLLPKMGLGGAALGTTDLVAGKDRVRIARQAANVPAEVGVPLEAPRLIDLDGVKLGVFGVVDPDLVRGSGVEASAAEDAARKAIAKLRAAGAQVVVALAHMDRVKARKLAREAPGADLVLVGADVPELGIPWPEEVGSSWLITPGSKGQVVTRMDLWVDAAWSGALFDAFGPERAVLEIEKIEAKRARLGAELARWQKDPSADPAFVQAKRDEVDRLEADVAGLKAAPRRSAPGASWFELRSIPIKKKLPCAPEIVQQKQELDRKIGEANLELAKNETPPPVPDGKAGYVGVEECGYCHKAAVDFWRTTKHFDAWETLETTNKHLNRDCIGCHVTGYGQPGGATLSVNEPLRDVQCETCHGPASLHVDADGKERPSSLTLMPAEDLCATQCHTPEHSDTFEWNAYLRDVVGKGHGEKLRKKLGKGATGLELRSAALEKAGRELGAGCPK